MIKEALLKQYGYKISMSDVSSRCDAPQRFIQALLREGLNVAQDKDWLYVDNEITFKKVEAKLNNRIAMMKIARHRVYEDCKGCKYLDEETHLGKLWCKKWDTDIWNVSTPYPEGEHKVNKGCVPFRYFGYAPDNPERPTQFNLNIKSAMAKGSDIIEEFVEHFNLYPDVGIFIDDKGTFIGEFTPSDRFGLKYNDDEIQMAIDNPHKHVVEEYPATPEGLKEMIKDWKKIWTGYIEYGTSDEEDKENILDKTAEDFKGHGQRPETNYDWINREEYKKKHNPQKTNQYDIAPSNVGDNKYADDLYNNFGGNDKELMLGKKK